MFSLLRMAVQFLTTFLPTLANKSKLLYIN